MTNEETADVPERITELFVGAANVQELNPSQSEYYAVIIPSIFIYIYYTYIYIYSIYITDPQNIMYHKKTVLHNLFLVTILFSPFF